MGYKVPGNKLVSIATTSKVGARERHEASCIFGFILDNLCFVSGIRDSGKSVRYVMSGVVKFFPIFDSIENIEVAIAHCFEPSEEFGIGCNEKPSLPFTIPPSTDEKLIDSFPILHSGG
jgi:hypothetical protein